MEKNHGEERTIETLCADLKKDILGVLSILDSTDTTGGDGAIISRLKQDVEKHSKNYKALWLMRRTLQEEFCEIFEEKTPPLRIRMEDGSIKTYSNLNELQGDIDNGRISKGLSKTS